MFLKVNAKALHDLAPLGSSFIITSLLEINGNHTNFFWFFEYAKLPFTLSLPTCMFSLPGLAFPQIFTRKLFNISQVIAHIIYSQMIPPLRNLPRSSRSRSGSDVSHSTLCLSYNTTYHTTKKKHLPVSLMMLGS